eukprot:2463827-Pyramimonas_sp.AAC.1
MWAAGGPTAGCLGVERQGFVLVFIGGPWAGQASEVAGPGPSSGLVFARPRAVSPSFAASAALSRGL